MTLPFDAYLFDLDGTLIDSTELILRSFEHTFCVHRGESPPRQYFLEEFGIPLAAQFRLVTDDEAEVEAMVQTYREHNLALHDEVVEAFEGMLETVRTIAERGASLAVVTNKLGSSAERGMKLCGFDELIPIMVSVEHVTHHKPHPESVELALSHLEVPADRALLIGDSPLDIQAGRAAGVKTAAVLWGPYSREQLETHAPDHWLQSPHEVLNVPPH